MIARRTWIWLSLFSGAAAAVSLVGCSRLTPRGKPLSQLPAPRMSPDTVVLEVACLSTSIDQTPALESIWNEADELRSTPDERARLAAHGFRCGVLGPTLPEIFHQLADQQVSSLEADDGVRIKRRRLQAKSDRASLESIGAHRERLDVLLVDQQSLRGESLLNAQAAIEIRPHPRGDGSVLIHAAPVVQFGEMKNRRIVEEGVWRYEIAPDHRTWSDLRMTVELLPGQTLLIGTTPDGRGLGGQFFAHPSDQGRRELLMIRLAQSQRDDLFNLPLGHGN